MSERRFAGVGWASEEHAVCVVDERGRMLEGRRYRHRAAVSSEWRLINATHNLLKLHRHRLAAAG